MDDTRDTPVSNEFGIITPYSSLSSGVADGVFAIEIGREQIVFSCEAARAFGEWLVEKGKEWQIYLTESSPK